MKHQQPTQDLQAYLAGSWRVERTLLDRTSGTNGTFTGVVRYIRNPDGGLHYREDGTMHWPTHSGPAFREYLLKPSSGPESMDVFFPDGRPFHVMSFTEQCNQDKHWCDPDEYRVSYLWEGPDSFGFTWDVRGPAKNLLLESHLVRIEARPNRSREATMKEAGTDLIVVSAVCVYNGEGRLLTVRKRGTDKFMHPGGKPEPGETAAEAASRELLEEVGIDIAPNHLEPLGMWLAVAANEAATNIEATVFTAPGTWDAHPSAEIAEIRWLDVDAPLPTDLAPLLTDHVLPALARPK